MSLISHNLAESGPVFGPVAIDRLNFDGGGTHMTHMTHTAGTFRKNVKQKLLGKFGNGEHPLYPFLQKYYSKHGEHDDGHHEKGHGAAISALTLLAFLFFLSILQQCIREHMAAMNAQVNTMTAGTGMGTTAAGVFKRTLPASSRQQAQYSKQEKGDPGDTNEISTKLISNAKYKRTTSALQIVNTQLPEINEEPKIYMKIPVKKPHSND